MRSGADGHKDGGHDDACVRGTGASSCGGAAIAEGCVCLCVACWNDMLIAATILTTVSRS